MYIYIQSRTFPPRKRPRERILHEKVSRVLLLLILFKSWGCAPKCSLWSASGEGSSLASDAVSRGDGDMFGGSHVTMSLQHLKNVELHLFSPSAQGQHPNHRPAAEIS